jgi:hypothetical protein
MGTRRREKKRREEKRREERKEKRVFAFSKTTPIPILFRLLGTPHHRHILQVAAFFSLGSPPLAV